MRARIDYDCSSFCHIEVNRLIAIFPPYHQEQIRQQLASVLWAVISQRLMPRVDGTGRSVAVEVMVNTPFIHDCIVDPGRTYLIKEAIASGTSQYGMQTFDQSIYGLYEGGRVSYDTALRWSSNPDEFKMRVQGVTSTVGAARDEMEVPQPDDKGQQPMVTRFGD